MEILMEHENLKLRTRKFALDVINVVESLPKDQVSKILGGQLLRAGTSVGANYRAVCRAKSNADFVSKFGTVEEEADESGFWLDLLVDAHKLPPVVAAPLIQEAGELTAIAVSSINTARKSGGRASAECGVRSAESTQNEQARNAQCAVKK
jgi:four helix bundle protein